MAEALIPVAYFSRSIDAELAKTKLESEGLSCFLQDNNLVRLAGAFSAPGGIKLLVRHLDEPRARAILDDDPRSAAQAVDEIFADGEEEVCPHCGSEEIRSEGATAFRAAVALMLVSVLLGAFFRTPLLLILIGVPILYYRGRRRCLECQYRWREN